MLHLHGKWLPVTVARALSAAETTKMMAQGGGDESEGLVSDFQPHDDGSTVEQ